MNAGDEDLSQVFIRTGDLVNPPRFFVIGDSHSLFFAGVEKMVEGHSIVPSAHEGYRVYYIGPGLAYSLIKPQSRNRSREKIMLALEEVKAHPQVPVIFCFGEVDCRYHIRSRTAALGQDHPEGWRAFARLTVKRYIAFLLEMKLAGFAPIIWAPPPSTPHPAESHAWITLGTMAERNAVTRDFIAFLKEEGARYAIPVLSVFDDLVDETFATKPDFSSDGTHLSQGHWPLWLEKAHAAGLPA